ncbi:MAG: substrate-binding domain-containing protein [Clostridiales bacterium]|nr:substrate-binding domain-containing protein [Clostridiales bacterium]
MKKILKATAGLMAAAVAVTAAPVNLTANAEEGTKKIAVIRNMASSDHTTQFFKGCTEEGEALGYEVDTYMSDGDDVKMQTLMEQALQQDYDIWVVSHANEGYQYDLVSQAVEKGISVVGFDCGGDYVDGVTYTTQSDEALTQISLDALIEKAEENGAEQPVKILEVNTLGALVPFDTRHSVVEQYEEEGKIEVVQMISPSTSGDYYSEVYTGVSTAIANNSDIAGIWTASTTFLDGILDALKDSGNTEIVCTGIDISDTEVARLAEEEQYYCCAAVDPYVIGVVDVRLAVLESLGVETPQTVQFDAVGVYNTNVSEGDTMATLAETTEGFGSSDLYDTEEIQALRAENE